jgi:hypothetical protein
MTMTTALIPTDIAHEPQACLGCGKSIDSATGIFGAGRPEAGDVTICLYCGHIHVYREDATGLRLDNPNTEEANCIAGDKRILAIQRARGK